MYLSISYLLFHIYYFKKISIFNIKIDYYSAVSVALKKSIESPSAKVTYAFL
jgi:hypothetical protein